MRTTSGLRAACVALALALLGPACTARDGDDGGDGVSGGTLRVLSSRAIAGLAGLDTAGYALLSRAYARTLYSYDLAGPPEQATDPVPDLATGPPRRSADRRTYTFTLRAGIRYAPPVNREVTARDFITAIERLYDKGFPSPGQVYSDLIAGAREFGAGKAGRISGLRAPDPHTLQITLDQPAEDFLSMLTMSYFAPVPAEYAADYTAGDNYSGHVAGSGPYKVDIYIPGRRVVLVRNPNWDAATDPLRKAWVDRIEITSDVPVRSIQRSIEREDADLSLDSHVPQAQVAALRADPERSRRLSVNTTGVLLFLVLQTDRRAGAIADVRVRQAINYAIDKVAYRDAVADRFAPTGELASTVLAPGSLGYRHYDLYPTPGGRGDPAKARALLAEAGYPDGLTLTFVAWGTGPYVDTIKPIRASLARAGIHLKLKTYKDTDLFAKSLAIPAKRLQHQVGQAIWSLDYLGDNARQSIVTQYDSRLDPAVSGNFSEYHNPAVNRLIDRALAEPVPARRAAMWARIDQRIMQDAPLVPLLWLTASFKWSSRVHGWVYDPWTVRPDLTAVWLDPPSP